MEYIIEEIDFENRETIQQSLCLLKKIFNKTFFTEKWWYWKFLSSPFGKAIGWLARDRNSNTIVALRILWKWKFTNGIESIDAYQMIDTATDTSFRGKGLFSQLTMFALKKLNYPLIFNFPNEKSSPLYLKLGWRTMKQQSTLYRIVNPLTSKNGRSGYMSEIPEMILKSITNRSMDKSFHTNYTIDFFKWRFCNHPYTIYFYFSYETTLFIYRIDKVRGINNALIMYVYNYTESAFRIFSKLLFWKGVYLIRYNALNNKVYEKWSKYSSVLKHGTLSFFTCNNEIYELSLLPSDTDFW